MGLLTSYPSEIFYLVLLIGIPLAFLSPYKAFLFVVFGLSARHFSASVQTRIFLGPYFNLNDALILTGILALFINVVGQKKPLRFPLPVALLFFMLMISIAHGYYAVGDFDINVIRYSKYSLVFPTVFLLSANFLSDSKRAQDFFFVLLAGGMTASLHHIYLSIQAYSNGLTFQSARDIGFLLHPGYFLLLSATQDQFYFRKKRIALALALPLFTVSLILDQTRSVWFGMFGAALLTPFVLKSPLKRLGRLICIFLFLYLTTTFLFSYFFPGAALSENIQSRLDQISDQYASGTNSRQIGARVELDAWLSSNILFGRGMGSQATFSEKYLGDDSIAFGHIGYVAYLTYTGLIGLFIYAVYIPVKILSIGKRLHDFSQDEDFIRLVAVMGIAGILMHAIISAFTSGYVSPSNMGLYYGAVIGLSHITQKKETNPYVRSLATHHRRDTLI